MVERTMIGFHHPAESHGFLSNWCYSVFSIDGKTFTSMEQYMMYRKAEIFADEEIMHRVMETNGVLRIKKLGRAVKEYCEPVWNGVRQIVVYRGLYAKFSQNPELCRALLNTGDAMLVECAVSDRSGGSGYP